MNEDKRTLMARNEGENLMVRKTQGDLLQKLRQLRQWQQKQQEHLMQDKEKKLSILYDQEKRLQAIHDYQKRILAQNGNFHSTRSGANMLHSEVYNKPLFHMQTTPSPSIQEVPGSHGPPKDLSQSMDMSSGFNLEPNGFLPTTNTVLLSPQHFQMNYSSEPPHVQKPNNPMLLTQKIHLPHESDEEMSQFTESAGSSISDIEGVKPMEDSVSEGSLENNGISDEQIKGSIDSSCDEDDDDEDDHGDYDDDENDDDGIGHSDDGNDDLQSSRPAFMESSCDDHNNTLTDDKIEDLEQTVMKKQDLLMDGKPSFDDIPIRPGLGTQTKTFEELLDKQLQVEQNNEQDNGTTTVAVKRTFLRKGEGIARFGLKERKTGKQRKSGAPDKLSEGSQQNLTPRAPVTKRIISNKQSFDISPNTLQRGSRMDPKRQVTSAESQSLSSRVIGPYPSVAVAMSTNVEEKLEVDGCNPVKEASAHPVIEDSFQERMKRWDEMDLVETRELNEFELLEEAAANCSLSSNSSTVLRIMGKKKATAMIDSNNNIPGIPQGDEELSAEEDVNNTLTEDKSDDEGEGTLKAGEEGGFDDTNSWEEHDLLDPAGVVNDVITALNTSTPDEKNRGKRSPHASSTPPTSALVTKLFPQLKNRAKEQPRADKPEQTTKQKQSPKTATVDRAQSPPGSSSATFSRVDGAAETGTSSAVREKLKELEKEIDKFREENTALHQLREEREKEWQELQRERSSFEKYRTEELEKLEKFKAEEERRLRRDKKVFEQYQRTSRAIPDKKEREEITSLKAKIVELQEDMKLRETRWSAAATRYKDRISTLEKEKKEMREEVKILQKQNLELQRKEQQKSRELQQYKAFERRKLTRSEEMQAKSVLSQGVAKTSDETEKQTTKEKEKSNTSSNSPPVTTEEPNKQSKSSCGERTATTDSERATKSPKSVVHSALKHSSVVKSTKDGSSPHSKQNTTSKSVRFEEDHSGKESDLEPLPKEICHNDGKREVINADGSRVVTFTNGTRKEISADGLSVIVTFFNGDVKQVMPDERVVYYYAEAQTMHTTYPDGMQVLHFPSNQVEKHYPDGTKEIIFPDQTVKYLYQSGVEECVFADGTVERISVDGDRIVEFPNGQRETYTKLFKKREYPDGTVKTVYTDGRQETRYPSGRLRVKDGEGRLVVDTTEPTTSHLPAS